MPFLILPVLPIFKELEYDNFDLVSVKFKNVDMCMEMKADLIKKQRETVCSSEILPQQLKGT